MGSTENILGIKSAGQERRAQVTVKCCVYTLEAQERMQTMFTSSRVDTSRGPMDTPNMYSSSEVANAGYSDGVDTYLGAGGAGCGINEMDECESI